MELEAKHVVPYLPYGLKVLHTKHIEFGKVIEKINLLESVHKDLCTFDLGSDWYFDTKENDCDIKLILKPLSQFEYDHIIQIKEHLGLGKWCDHYDQYFDAWFDDAENVKKLVLQCPYEIMQFFLECHFDVFSLIDAGLAVELTTI